MDAGTDETDTVILSRPVVVLLEILAVGPHIHKENRRIQRLVRVFVGNNCFLDGVHTADGRTIAVIAMLHVPRTNTLEPGDLLGFLVVGGPDHMTLKGTRGAENALEFYTGNHIWMFAVEIGIDHRWIERISSGGKNHRTNVQSDRLFLHAVLYSFGLAGGDAGETLTAGHAVEAFGCFGLGLLFAKS